MRSIALLPMEFIHTSTCRRMALEPTKSHHQAPHPGSKCLTHLMKVRTMYTQASLSLL